MQGSFQSRCPDCPTTVCWQGEYTARPACPGCGHQFDRVRIERDDGIMDLRALAIQFEREYSPYFGHPLKQLDNDELVVFLYCANRFDECQTLEELQDFGCLVRGDPRKKGYSTRVVGGLRRLFQECVRAFKLTDGPSQTVEPNEWLPAFSLN